MPVCYITFTRARYVHGVKNDSEILPIILPHHVSVVTSSH